MKAYTFPILMAEVIFRISSHSQVSKEETEHFFKINFTAVPYIFEIVIFVLLFELALIVFLNYPFPVFPFR